MKTKVNKLQENLKRQKIFRKCLRVSLLHIQEELSISYLSNKHDTFVTGIASIFNK